ncbi:hypothetical protein D9M70_310370 [compost metagenome]
MGEFIEERLNACIRLGAAADDSYFTNVTMTAGGSRYASLKNGKPYRTFDISFLKPRSDLALEVASLYHRTYGGYAGFRVKCWDDFTTALDGISAYAATDCILGKISGGVYQLLKEYGRDKAALASIGRPKRIIYKPVSGKVAAAVNGQALPAAQWAVNTTTGRITLAANKSRPITGISKASSAVVTVGSHTFIVGDSVVISGVVGMTQMNGRRALVTATSGTTITVAINSALFSDYTGGGTVQTQPLDSGSDILTAGCEFDIPVAFDSHFSVSALETNFRDVGGLRLVELLNP